MEKKALNEAMKAAVKRSSLDFGHENIVYESVMSGQMRRETGGPGVDFQKRKAEISEMTNSLRKVLLLIFTLFLTNTFHDMPSNDTSVD